MRTSSKGNTPGKALKGSAPRTPGARELRRKLFQGEEDDDASDDDGAAGAAAGGDDVPTREEIEAYEREQAIEAVARMERAARAKTPRKRRAATQWFDIVDEADDSGISESEDGVDAWHASGQGRITVSAALAAVSTYSDRSSGAISRHLASFLEAMEAANIDSERLLLWHLKATLAGGAKLLYEMVKESAECRELARQGKYRLILRRILRELRTEYTEVAMEQTLYDELAMIHKETHHLPSERWTLLVRVQQRLEREHDPITDRHLRHQWSTSLHKDDEKFFRDHHEQHGAEDFRGVVRSVEAHARRRLGLDKVDHRRQGLLATIGAQEDLITIAALEQPSGPTRICIPFQKGSCSAGAGCLWKHACEVCGSTEHGNRVCPSRRPGAWQPQPTQPEAAAKAKEVCQETSTHVAEQHEGKGKGKGMTTLNLIDLA